MLRLHTGNVLVRQRPAIGDALLLGPLVQLIKLKYPGERLTVVTDGMYAAGALSSVFALLNGVDRVESISALEWTTESNHRVEPHLPYHADNVPPVVARARRVFDCNGQFIEFERRHGGDPPHGIAEFWVRYHGFDPRQADLKPRILIPESLKKDAAYWRVNEMSLSKPAVGIVLRAGDPVRDWNFDGAATTLADGLWSLGCTPVGIDPTLPLPSHYGISVVGKRIDEIAAILSTLDLVITPDTGLLHLAEAVGTPTIALWGIMRPELRVAGYDCRVVPQVSKGYCTGEDLQGCRCGWKFQQWSCLRRLRVKEILDAARDTLREKGML
jgi:hypothetical protein